MKLQRGREGGGGARREEKKRKNEGRATNGWNR